MLLTTTIGRLNQHFGFEKSVDMLAEAGFDSLDFSAHSSEKFYTDVHNKEYYLGIRKRVEDKGMSFTQAHAYFGSSDRDEEKTKIIFNYITTSMKNASYLGAKHIVVHPCQHLSYYEEGNPEFLFEYNMEFYNKLIPYCEEYGIKVALENMWQHPRDGWKKISHSTCSKPEEFIRYMDELNNDNFVACLDIGHAALVCEDIPEFIKKLGNKRLKCLHTHDVDGMADLHTLPFFGIIEWNKVMKALSDIGYEGDLTYEADNFYNGKPLELYPAAAKYMEQTGRYLINKFNEYNSQK